MRYTIKVTRTIVASAAFEVNAETYEEAEDQARELAHDADVPWREVAARTHSYKLLDVEQQLFDVERQQSTNKTG